MNTVAVGQRQEQVDLRHERRSGPARVPAVPGGRPGFEAKIDGLRGRHEAKARGIHAASVGEVRGLFREGGRAGLEDVEAA